MTTTVKVIRPHPVTVKVLRGLRGRPGADGTGGSARATRIVFNSDTTPDPINNRYSDWTAFKVAVLAAQPGVRICFEQSEEVPSGIFDMNEGTIENTGPWKQRFDIVLTFLDGAVLTNWGSEFSHFRVIFYSISNSPVCTITGIDELIFNAAGRFACRHRAFFRLEGDPGSATVLSLRNSGFFRPAELGLGEPGEVGAPVVEVAHGTDDFEVIDGNEVYYAPAIACVEGASIIGQDTVQSPGPVGLIITAPSAQVRPQADLVGGFVPTDLRHMDIHGVSHFLDFPVSATDLATFAAARADDSKLLVATVTGVDPPELGIYRVTGGVARIEDFLFELDLYVDDLVVAEHRVVDMDTIVTGRFLYTVQAGDGLAPLPLLPPGGTTGQVCAKLSDVDYNADWQDLDSLSRVGFVYSQINTIADPGPGKVRLNSLPVPAFPYQDVSVIAFDNLDAAGKDTTAIAHILGAGNRIYMQDPAVSTAFVKWTVTGPASMLAGYWTIPVELIESSETEFADLTPITALFALGAGAEVTQTDLDAAVATAEGYTDDQIAVLTSSPKLAPDPTALPDNDFIVTASGLYVARTPADVRAALGTGTPSSSNFLRGDGTWATPASATVRRRVIAAARITNTTNVQGTLLWPTGTGQTTLGIAPGAMYCYISDIDSQQTVTLVLPITATAATAGQAVTIAAFAIGTDGLPDGAPIWTQNIAASAAVNTAAVSTVVLPAPPWCIAILNPSGNAGTVTVKASLPSGPGFAYGSGLPDRGALVATGLAAMPASLSTVAGTWGVDTSSSSSRWAIQANMPHILGRS